MAAEKKIDGKTSARAWVFTLNNPTEMLVFDESKVRYAIYQREAGENGTPHFQGYIELAKPQRLSFMKKMIPGAHFETRKGTRDQARDYCRKAESRLDPDANPTEFGTWEAGAQGSRTDLLEVKRKIDEGATILTIAEEHFSSFIRYERGFRAYKRAKTPKRTTKTTVDLYYGAPGVGKTWRANEEEPDAYWKNATKWWDGYEGQEAVIIDDFHGGIQWTELKHILDAYDASVEYKGGTLRFTSRRVIITSNDGPGDWYKRESIRSGLDALYRRIDRILFFTEDAVYIGPTESWQLRRDWINEVVRTGRDPRFAQEAGTDDPQQARKEEEAQIRYLVYGERQQ